MRSSSQLIWKKLFLLPLVLLFLLLGCKQGDDPNEIVTVHCLKSVQITGDDPITYSFTYDAQGNLLTSDHAGGYRDVYTYDEACNVLTYQLYKSDNSLLSDYHYIYDARGNMLTAVSYFNGKTEPSSQRIFTYDKRGNKLSEAWYQGNKVTSNTDWVYDSAGNCTDRFEYINQVLTLHCAQAYSQDGKLLTILLHQTSASASGENTSYTEYTYNEEGLLCDYKYYNGGKNEGRTPLLHNTFDYDEYGNLIRKNEAIYTYLSVSIPRYLAEKVAARQERLRHDLGVYTLHPV